MSSDRFNTPHFVFDNYYKLFSLIFSSFFCGKPSGRARGCLFPGSALPPVHGGGDGGGRVLLVLPSVPRSHLREPQEEEEEGGSWKRALAYLH